MTAEILNTTPNSGDFLEKHFGDTFDFRLWVKFTDDNYEEWVGCFSKSYDTALSKIFVDNKNGTSFVVAGGQGYLVDIKNKSLLCQLDEMPLIESAIKTSDPDYFIAGSFYWIYILDTKGQTKILKPDLIVDGIYFTEQKGDKAIGSLATAENQYEKNLDFELDLNSFELTITTKSWTGLKTVKKTIATR